MPSFRPGSHPVLGYRSCHVAAQLQAFLRRLRGEEVAVVRHRPAPAGLSARPGTRFYLIDTRIQRLEHDFMLPATNTEERWLTVAVDWWIHDPLLLLTTAPGEAPAALRRNVIRRLNTATRSLADDELLAIRRRIETALGDRAATTTTGLSWTVTAVRANAVPRQRPWRDEIDLWLHQQLNDPAPDPAEPNPS